MRSGANQPSFCAASFTVGRTLAVVGLLQLAMGFGHRCPRQLAIIFAPRVIMYRPQGVWGRRPLAFGPPLAWVQNAHPTAMSCRVRTLRARNRTAGMNPAADGGTLFGWVQKAPTPEPGSRGCRAPTLRFRAWCRPKAGPRYSGIGPGSDGPPIRWVRGPAPLRSLPRLRAASPRRFPAPNGPKRHCETW